MSENEKNHKVEDPAGDAREQRRKRRKQLERLPLDQLVGEFKEKIPEFVRVRIQHEQEITDNSIRQDTIEEIFRGLLEDATEDATEDLKDIYDEIATKLNMKIAPDLTEEGLNKERLRDNPEGWVYYKEYDDHLYRLHLKKSRRWLQNFGALGKEIDDVLVAQDVLVESLHRALLLYPEDGEIAFRVWFLRKLDDRQSAYNKKAFKERWGEPLERGSEDYFLYLKKCYEDKKITSIEYEKCIQSLVDEYDPGSDERDQCEEFWKNKDKPLRMQLHDECCYRKNKDEDIYDIFIRKGSLSLYTPVGEDGKHELGDFIEDENAEHEVANVEEEETHVQIMDWAVGDDPALAFNVKAEYLGRSLDYIYLKEAKEEAGKTSRSIADFYRTVEQHDGAIDDAVRKEYGLTKTQAKQIPTWRALYTFDVISVCHVGMAQNGDHRLFFYLDRSERVHRALCVMLRGMAPGGIANDAVALKARRTQERLRRFMAVIDKGLIEMVLVSTDDAMRLFLADVKKPVFAKGEEVNLEPCDIQFDYSFSGNTSKVLREHLGISHNTLHDDREGKPPGRLERYKEIRHTLFKGYLTSGTMKNAYLFEGKRDRPASDETGK